MLAVLAGPGGNTVSANSAGRLRVNAWPILRLFFFSCYCFIFIFYPRSKRAVLSLT